MAEELFHDFREKAATGPETPSSEMPADNDGRIEGPIAEESALPPRPSGSVPASILAGIVGCLIGVILCTLAGGTSTSLGQLLFLLIPLCIGIFHLLFRGDLGVPGLIVTIVFSAIGLYLVPSFSAAAGVAARDGVSVFAVPLLAFSGAGDNTYFSKLTFDTAHVFPPVFVIMGILIAWQLYRMKRGKQRPS